MDLHLEDMSAHYAALARYDTLDSCFEFLLNSISLLNSSEHSDLLIRCKDGTTIHAHKTIVCPQSKFFADACKSGHFKVWNCRMKLEFFRLTFR
jgi:hypothetical protein